MTQAPRIVWFKRDLRINDHAPLLTASQANASVIPLYIVEPEYWTQSFASRRHWHFIHNCLCDLDSALAELGQQLVVKVGDACDVIRQLHLEHHVTDVYPSEQLACLSDDDLIQVLITFVADIYHNQPHGSLGGETPRDCWDRLVALESTPFTPNGRVVRKAFGRRFERQLRGDGVLFARTGYSCDALREAFLHSPERKVEIRVDTHDLGWIVVKVGGVWHAATANVSGLDQPQKSRDRAAIRTIKQRHEHHSMAL